MDETLISEICASTETALVNAKRAVRAWLTGVYRDRDRQMLAEKETEK